MQLVRLFVGSTSEQFGFLDDLADLPEIGKKIHDDLEHIREKLLAAQQQTVTSALPIESLAPIGKAMAGEHVSIKSILASLDEVMRFLLEKIPKNVYTYTQVQGVRNAIRDAASMVPLGTDLTT